MLAVVMLGAAAAMNLALPPGVVLQTLTPWGALLAVVVGVYGLVASGRLIPGRTHDAIVAQHTAATASAERRASEWKEIALTGTQLATKLADSSSVAAEVLQKADRLIEARGGDHDESGQ